MLEMLIHGFSDILAVSPICRGLDEHDQLWPFHFRRFCLVLAISKVIGWHWIFTFAILLAVLLPNILKFLMRVE